MLDLSSLLSLLEEMEKKRKRSAALMRWQQTEADDVLRRRRQKPGPKPRGPKTGGKPHTGSTPVWSAVDEELRKRHGGGGGGGSSVAPVSGRSGGSFQSGSPSFASPPTAPSSPLAGPKDRLAIASGSQPCVVKLVSFAAGGTRIGALLTYQSREGEIAVEDDAGQTFVGPAWVEEIADEWSEEEGRQQSKDVMRLSIRLPDDRFGSDDDIGDGLKQALPGHRIAWRVTQEVGSAGEDHRRFVDVVVSAAARKQDGQTSPSRIFDTRKSLSAMEGALVAAFGEGTQVDVHGFAHGVEGVARYLGQLRQGGRHEVYSARLDRSGRFVSDVALSDPKSAVIEARDWKRDLRSQERRDVAHIVLSAKPGTAKDAFISAARAMLAREFENHRYVFALHEDRDHLHVHVVVKMRSETGERLHPKIQDFKRWRQTLAEEARECDIPMDAVSRFERANPPGYTMKDIRRVERGEATEAVRRRVEAVRNGDVHIPTRDEGRRRAEGAARAWSEASRSARGSGFRPEPQPRPGIVRLYRAERLDMPASSQPLFTRDRAAAAQIAVRHGATLRYIDVTADELHRLTPSRSDPQNMFVVGREMAATAEVISPEQLAELIRFEHRAMLAVRDRAETMTENPVSNMKAKDTDMADLNVMNTAFKDMDKSLDGIASKLPAEKVDAFDGLRKKLQDQQRAMLDAQETIEKRRGRIEGETYVPPKPMELQNFVAEKRGEDMRYSHRKTDGRAGAVAFTDHGDRVEIGNWRDREVVLAAMQVASEKWGSLSINGTDRYKALAIELAAEHGFKVTNPELQDALNVAREKMALRSEKAGIAAGRETQVQSSTQPQSQLQPEPQAPVSAAQPAPIDEGEKVRPVSREQDSMLAAMKQAAAKWGAIGINGTDEEKASAVEIAVENGIEVANPELQAQVVQAKARLAERLARDAELEKQRLGFTDASMVRPVPTEAEEAPAEEMASASQLPIDEGQKVRPVDRDRESMVAAMKQASEKWGAIGVNGTEREKALAVEIAAEHGFALSNPELQDRLAEARRKVEEQRQKETEKQTARENKRLGFVEGSEPVSPSGKTDAEIDLALQTVRERTQAEAKREVAQAQRSAATAERPFDGGGDDHAYRTPAEAKAATRAERAAAQNPGKPIPADVNQSPEIDRQRQTQEELLAEKETNRQAETQKQTNTQRKPRQKQ